VYTNCQCSGGQLYGINTVVSSSTTYEECAGAPYPTPEPTVDISPPAPNFTTPDLPDINPSFFFNMTTLPECAGNDSFLLSETCATALNKSLSAQAANLYFTGGHCTPAQDNFITYAASEAQAILQAAAEFPDTQGVDGMALIHYWFGDNFFDYINTIQGKPRMQLHPPDNR
jgi:hypothetical protein